MTHSETMRSIWRERERLRRAERRASTARAHGDARGTAFWTMIADGAWSRMVRIAEDAGLMRVLPPQITFERRKR